MGSERSGRTFEANIPTPPPVYDEYMRVLLRVESLEARLAAVRKSLEAQRTQLDWLGHELTYHGQRAWLDRHLNALEGKSDD